MRLRLKGSYTVEAAFVMTISIAVIMSVLYLALYLHDTVVVEAVLKETVEKGRILQEGDCQDIALAEDAKKRAAPLFCIKSLDISLWREEGWVRAKATGRLALPGWIYGGWGDGSWSLVEQTWGRKPQEDMRKGLEEQWRPDTNGN